jgi:hypothetical protein
MAEWSSNQSAEGDIRKATGHNWGDTSAHVK